MITCFVALISEKSIEKIIECRKGVLLISVFVFFSAILQAQSDNDSLSENITLQDCINYALENNPSVQISTLDQEITTRNIRHALSGWYPQITASADLQHYIKQPVSIFPNLTNPSVPERLITIGVANTSTLTLSANQNLYTTGLLFASKTAKNMHKLAYENTESVKINLIVNVSIAFFGVLLAEEQLNIINEDVFRLRQDYENAYSLFKEGLTNLIDYKQALISLNNALAQRKNAEETILANYAYLKEQIGYPVEKKLNITYDTDALLGSVMVDTSIILVYDNRIEYKILQTNMRLQHSQIGYYKWLFLPSFSAFINYNLVYQNDTLSHLYRRDFPNSQVGITFSFPLFQGTAKWQYYQRARVQYKQLELSAVNLKNQINTEYIQAISDYKGNLKTLNTSDENVKLATEIYNTVKYQYEKGIVSYLEVIVAEASLRDSQLNFLNSLFTVLVSKVNLDKALGEIKVK